MREPAVAAFRSNLVAVLTQQIWSVQSIQATATVEAAKIRVVLCVLKILEVDQEVPVLLRLELPLGDEVASLWYEVVPICLVERTLVRQLVEATYKEGSAFCADECSHRWQPETPNA